PGLDSFAGSLLHTALWDDDVALAGKRVGVIGTGATALQLVPAIADQVEYLTVFQRTPIWVLPKVDPPVTGALGRLMGRAPVRSTMRVAGNVATEALMSGMLRAPGWLSGIADRSRPAMEAPVRAWMRSQVYDPVVREKLIPRYGLGCKRPSMSGEYLRAF